MSWTSMLIASISVRKSKIMQDRTSLSMSLEEASTTAGTDV